MENDIQENMAFYFRSIIIVYPYRIKKLEPFKKYSKYNKVLNCRLKVRKILRNIFSTQNKENLKANNETQKQ